MTLLVLEGVARLVWRWQASTPPVEEGRQYLRYDPVLGWSKIPGARALFRRREYTTEVRVNSQGLRDVERSYTPPANALRLLAVGDSFVEAYTVPFESSVTQALERELQRQQCAAEVVNGGTQAYSTDQEYLFYRDEGRRYGARVVLHFFYYNDVLFNARQTCYGRFKPVLDDVDGELRLRRTVKVAPVAAEGEATDGAVPASPVSQPRGSVLLQWVLGRLALSRPDTYAHLARWGLAAPPERRVAREELAVYAARATPEVEHAWEKTAAILAQMRRDVEAQGARYVLVYVPSRMEAHDDAWTLTQSVYGLSPGEWRREAVIERLRSYGSRSGYPVVDLTPALRASDRGWLGRPYFANDGHWTVQGHAVAARALAESLRGLGLLEACPLR